MTGDEIRTKLDGLESQTMELAENLIGTIAEIRARLILLETAIDMSALVDDEDEDRHRC